MYRTTILIFLLFLAGCSIEILPRHASDDEYGKYGSSVEKFSKDSILVAKQVSAPQEITVEEINYKQLQFINEKSDRTWVILTATWCAECAYELENNAKKMKELQNEGVNTVLIYTNYDVKNIQKELFKLGSMIHAYILNAKDYSSNETDKITKFVKEVLASSPKFNKMTVPAAVPQNFFFSSGKLTMYKTGSHIDADSGKGYFR